MKVPYGKRFNILFSDGSKVSLNSGSILRYPVKFLSNQKREVFLQGEAYFDVAEDKSNLFVVNSEGINVEVYGTKFMVKNYSEDFNSDIVLVSGSVAIKNNENEESTLLKPGFKGSVDKTTLKITESKINTKVYTSWIEGEVVFRKESFSQILKKLFLLKKKLFLIRLYLSYYILYLIIIITLLGKLLCLLCHQESNRQREKLEKLIKL